MQHSLSAAWLDYEKWEAKSYETNMFFRTK